MPLSLRIRIFVNRLLCFGEISLQRVTEGQEILANASGEANLAPAAAAAVIPAPGPYIAA